MENMDLCWEVTCFPSSCLELETSNGHCKRTFLETSRVSPLKEDWVELAGTQIFVAVLVQESVDNIHNMRVQFLVTNPVGDLGELSPVDAPALGVEVEHCSL